MIISGSGKSVTCTHVKYRQQVPTPSAACDGADASLSPSSFAAAGPSAATMTPRRAERVAPARVRTEPSLPPLPLLTPVTGESADADAPFRPHVQATRSV